MPPYTDAFMQIEALAGSETRFNVAGQEPGPDGPVLEVTSDATASEAARPRGEAFQQAGFEIEIDGVVLDLSTVTGTIAVSRSYDERLQQFSFEVALTTPTAPLGSPFIGAGPSTGKKTVDVFGVYITATGRHRYDLIRGGIADTSDREGGADGYTESISGVCRGGRFDHQVATLVLPPGHGLPRGRVLRLLADAAGETQTTLEDGNPTVKELQVVDGDWLAVGAEQQEVENRRVFWDRQGYLVNPQVGRPRTGEQTAWSFEERDYLLGAKYRIRHKADVLTDVTLTGTEQIAADAESTGETIKNTEQIYRAVYAPAQPGYIQSTGGTYSAQAAGDAPKKRIVRRIRYEQRLRQGVVVYERTQTWAFLNVLAARYEYNLGTSSWDPLAVYTTDNVLGSSSLAYRDHAESLTTLTLSEVWHYYDKEGFRHTVDPLATPERAWLQGPYGILLDSEGNEVHPEAGYYLGSISRVWAYYAPKRALLTRSIATLPYAPWGELEPDNGRLLMGSDAVVLPTASLVRVGETVFNVEGDPTGFKVRERTSSWGYGSPEVSSGSYLYGDGKERRDEEEQFLELSAVDVDYLPTAEGTHKKLTTTYEFGDFVDSVEEPGLQGYPPAIERMEVQERNLTAYADGELDQFAKTAKRSETRQIKVQVTAPELEDYHVKGVLKTSIPWAESEEELAFVGQSLIDESAAADVDFELPANFMVEPGQKIRSKYRPLGVDHDMRIRRVRWTQPLKGPVTTQVEAKLYGW